MEHAWKQKAASGDHACMSRWQFRKLVRHQKQWAMSSSGASFDQQVKSLAAQTDEKARAGDRMDAAVQTQLGLDIKFPNFWPYYHPADIEEGVQTDQSFEGVHSQPCHEAGGQVLASAGTWEPCMHAPQKGLRVRLCKSVDVIPAGEEGVMRSSQDSLCDVRFNNFTSGSLLFWASWLEMWVPLPRFAAAVQTGAAASVSVATQSWSQTETGSMFTQTYQACPAHVLEYGDAIKAKQNVLARPHLCRTAHDMT